MTIVAWSRAIIPERVRLYLSLTKPKMRSTESQSLTSLLTIHYMPLWQQLDLGGHD